MAVKDYIDTNDFTKEELLDMIELAQSMKAMIKEGGRYPLILKNQTLGMIFQQVTWAAMRSSSARAPSSSAATRPSRTPPASWARSSTSSWPA